MDDFHKRANDIQSGCTEFIVQFIVIVIGVSLLIFLAVITGTAVP